MNAKDFFTYIYPKTIVSKLAYHGLIEARGPITLTFSVTNICQSRCKSCNIYQIYPQNLAGKKASEELSIEEIEKIFKSLGRIYFFNISGGEPFLRGDLVDIAEAAVDHLKPAIIHSPTNALTPDRTVDGTRGILDMLNRKGLKTPVTIKPSIDGVGKKHDDVRGVPGNFDRLLETIRGLKELEREYDNFHLELGTVVSNFNKEDLGEIEDFVHSIGVESYRNEIAEQRTEFFNVGDPITPSGQEYAELMRDFSRKIIENLPKKRPLARITESLRLVYYELAARTVNEERQVIPCYAGITNVHLTPYGHLWPCCVLGYDKPMGDLRETDYNFWEVWHSEQADEVRLSIKNRECACPLANQKYSDIICDTRSLVKALFNVVRYS